MTERPLTVDQVQYHASTMAAMAASLLAALASGKYDKEVTFAETMLGDLGVVFPPSAAVDDGLKLFLALNKMTAGRGAVIPDGRGGYMTQSWADDPRHELNPDGSFRE